MPLVGLRGAGESKTLAWGFAMVPHRLRALVLFFLNVRNEAHSVDPDEVVPKGAA